MSEDAYLAARSSRTIAKAASRLERMGVVTDNDERKARFKGGLPGTAAVAGGAGLGYAGLRSGAHRMDAVERAARRSGASGRKAVLSGLRAAPKATKVGGAVMAAGIPAAVVGMHRSGNKARRAKGKPERNAAGFIRS